LTAQGAAALQGIVVRGFNDPLSRARVELRSDDNPAALLDTTTTEDDGRFVFQSVRPGRYRLVVTRAGYVRPPLTITLAAGQSIRDLRLSMTPAAAIYGRVYDNKGDPMGNIEVQALKASYSEGRRVLSPVQSVQTNDLGEYRLFWLAPGRYYVMAAHPQAQSVRRRMLSFGTAMIGGPDGTFFAQTTQADPALGGFSLEEEPQEERYVPVYFSGTISEESASAVDVRAGSDVGGVNIVVTPVFERHVRGIVVDGSTGQPAQYGSVKRAEGTDELRIRIDDIQVNPENGSFDIALLPGSYTLIGNAGGGSGYATVRVGDSDINNLTIVAMAAFNVPGRIAVEGRSGADLAAVRISLRRDPPPARTPARSQSSYSMPLPNGSFTLEAGPGDYRVNVAPILNLIPDLLPSNLPPALRDDYVKSIRLGTADVLNTGLHLERPPAAPLEIVLGTNPGTVEGTVMNAAQQVSGDVSVVLLPDVRRRSDLYRSATSDPSGHFRFERVPPGDYKLFAWAEVDSDAWYDPDFISVYENRGKPVRVAEGSKQDVPVTVIPAP